MGRYWVDVPSIIIHISRYWHGSQVYNISQADILKQTKMAAIFAAIIEFIFCIKIAVLLAATKQVYQWSCPSVRPSAWLSIFPSVIPFSQCFCHLIIMTHSGLITIEKSDAREKVQGQRSKVWAPAVKTIFLQFEHFRITATSVEFTDGYEMMHTALNGLGEMPHGF